MTALANLAVWERYSSFRHSGRPTSMRLTARGIITIRLSKTPISFQFWVSIPQVLSNAIDISSSIDGTIAPNLRGRYLCTTCSW